MNWKAAIACLLLAASSSALAEPVGSTSTFPLMNDGSGEALAQRRAMRCQDDSLTPDEVIEACQSLFKRHILDNSTLWTRLMRAYERKHDWAAAIDAFSNGRAGVATPSARLAILYAAAGRRDDALAEIGRAMEHSQGAPDTVAARCLVRAILGDLAAALADCSQAVAAEDDNATNYDDRAVVYFRLGRLDEALADCDKSLALLSGRAASLYLRGVIEQKRGDAAKGAADIAAALKRDSFIAQTYAQYGVAP